MLLRPDTISYYLPSVQWAGYRVSGCAAGYCNRIHFIGLVLSQVFCLRDFKREPGGLGSGSLSASQYDVTAIPQISMNRRACLAVSEYLSEWKRFDTWAESVMVELVRFFFFP